MKVRTGKDPFSDGSVQTVQLPRKRPSDIDSVVALRFETVPEVVDPGVIVTQSDDGSIALRAFDAEIHGTEAKYEGSLAQFLKGWFPVDAASPHN